MSVPPQIFENFVAAVHDKSKALIHEQHMQAQSVAMGTLDEKQITSIIALAMLGIDRAQESKQDRDKRTLDEILFRALLQYIDDLNREIADMEAAFRTEFGDAWREELALRIFGEDDIPHWREGETIDEYRARLEQKLVDELLNEDGTIKDEYKNDPAMRKYAQWAQKIYNRDAAQAIASDLKNPHATHVQTQEMLDRLEDAANSEQNIYAARELEGHEEQKQAVLGVDDNHRDDQGLQTQSDFTQDFLKPQS